MDIDFYFLHLEGMDLAGKSSVAKAIKEKCGLDWQINNNRLCDKNIIYQFIDNIAKRDLFDDEIYGNLYYTALLADLKKFELSSNIIQDSTILLRSINYHTELGNTKLAKKFEELIEFHPVPTYSFYLTADINSRIDRLVKRMKLNQKEISKNDYLILQNPEKFEEADIRLFELSSRCFNSILIDTTNLTIEEVADYIIDYCKLEKKCLVKKLKKCNRD